MIKTIIESGESVLIYAADEWDANGDHDLGGDFPHTVHLILNKRWKPEWDDIGEGTPHLIRSDAERYRREIQLSRSAG
jgi:hypothetical protein